MSVQRHRAWLVAFVLVVFTAGVAAGVLAAGHLRFAPRAGEPRPFLPPPDVVARMLADDLQLTPEQRAALDAIVADKRRSLAARREEMRQRFEQDADSLANDVRQILTPAQREKFEEIIARVRSRFRNPDTSARRTLR